MEIGWGLAFKQALKYVVYSIIWVIIGILLVAAGVTMLMSRAFILGVILLVISVALLELGAIASYYKTFSAIIHEIIVKHEKEKQSMQTT